jgi:hypothetical protein
MNETQFNRQKAMERWNVLPVNLKQKFFKDYVNSGKFTMALSHKELTGREIEFILLDKSCQIIADAIEKGDAYRADVKHLNDWVDETVEKGIMTRDEAIKVIYPEMNKIYNQHFPRV